MAYDNMEHFCNSGVQQHFQRRCASTELQWMALVTVTFKCIEWEWHKSLPVNSENLWNYQIRQKCEIYTEMQWTFGIQAILDTINAKY